MKSKEESSVPTLFNLWHEAVGLVGSGKIRSVTV